MKAVYRIAQVRDRRSQTRVGDRGGKTGGTMSASVGELTTRDAGDIATAQPAALSPEDRAALRDSVRTLERSTLAGRLAGLAGRPLEILGSALPAAVSQTVSRAAEAALKVALRAALTTLPRRGRT